MMGLSLMIRIVINGMEKFTPNTAVYPIRPYGGSAVAGWYSEGLRERYFSCAIPSSDIKRQAKNRMFLSATAGTGTAKRNA